MPGYRPKKRLGQHFLVAPEIINKIVSHAAERSYGTLLEIGPGRGELTIPLSGLFRNVLAVERDPRLTKILQERLRRAKAGNVIVDNSDILKWDFSHLSSFRSNGVQVVGNLPYNISSPVLEILIEKRGLLNRAVLMLQREVAQRLCAEPGTKAYGALTLLVQYYARCTPLMNIGPEAFYPKPAVHSMVVEMDFEHPYHRQAFDEVFLKRVIKGAFYHRRKTILNSLYSFLPAEKKSILEALKSCGIDPRRRGESLNMEDFLALEEALQC